MIAVSAPAGFMLECSLANLFSLPYLNLIDSSLRQQRKQLLFSSLAALVLCALQHHANISVLRHRTPLHLLHLCTAFTRTLLLLHTVTGHTYYRTSLQTTYFMTKHYLVNQCYHSTCILQQSCTSCTYLHICFGSNNEHEQLLSCTALIHYTFL